MAQSILTVDGLPIYIISKYGTKTRSTMFIEKIKGNMEPKIFWRKKIDGMNSSGTTLGCELSYVKSITKQPEPNQNQIVMLFSDLKFIFEIDSSMGSIFNEIYTYLAELLKKSQHMRIIERDQNTDKATGSQTQTYQQSIAIRNSHYQCVVKEELLLQLCTYLRFKEGYLTVEKVVASYRFYEKSVALRKWIAIVKSTNDTKMVEDQHRWRLHATANQEIDLQAWYHSLFYKEVYRLRGYFWYKDAVLPTYRQSYDLVDNALTPLEEAALAHVLCSPDTTYGDVAGQMFVVQALIPPARFTLFQQLAAQGSNVVKYPRQGRPAKKLFRFSFVEGNIYLTWKGKFGNQGVGIAEVTSVRAASASDMSTWATGSGKADQYLSVVCADRSVDLFFESTEERDNWRELLQALHAKEQGNLGIESMDPGPGAPEFEWLVLYASIGKSEPQESLTVDLL
jgi:hypothetical protein